MNSSEIPPEALDPAPAGYPPARRAEGHIAPVRCVHGVRWRYLGGKGAYVADDAAAFAHPGHELPAQMPTCFDRMWDPERDEERAS